MTDQTPTVDLTNPIKVEGKDVKKITLRKPATGELRGLKLTNILQMDTDAMLKLLPRITQPPLSPQQVADLDPADFTDMAGKTVLFFAKKEQLQDLETT